MRKAGNSGNQRPLPTDEPTERELTTLFDAAIRELLPNGWQVDLRTEEPSRRSATDRPDAVFRLRAPDGTSTEFIVEVKRRLDPKLVPVVRDQLARYGGVRGGGGMVLAAFLSPRARELLTQAGLSFADATGNVRLESDRPAVFITTQGVQADPWSQPGDRPLRSLKGPTAGRVVRALCDFRPPYRLEELARRSGTSLGSVSRVFTFLEMEALISREQRGPVTDVQWPELLRRWSDDYSFARTNRPRTFLEPRGLPAFQEKLKQTPLRYAITGSLAAAEIAPIAVPRLASVYVEDIPNAVQRLGLRPAETGGNVVLAEPFDWVAFERTQERHALTYAALSQVAVDLLTGPGRSPSEGEALIDWMRKHEDAWRH